MLSAEKAKAIKPIGSMFVVRMLPFLLLLNVIPAEAYCKKQFWYTDKDEIISGTPQGQNVYTDVKADDSVYGTDIPVSAVKENLLVDTVNGYRSSVYPKSSDMHYMALNQKFAAKAKKLALRCDLATSEPGVLFVASANSTDSFYDAVRAIRTEGEAAIKAGLCIANKVHRACRFYRDLMEAGADGIGCAKAHCPDVAKPWVVYCVTNAKSSNEPYKRLAYKEGTPCQMCPKSSGYCYYGLCVYATKTAILEKTPDSVFTCDAPCLNCGERKDNGKTCFCQCPRGYDSEVDCSKGSGQLTCSACRMSGTPCRNGGQEAILQRGSRCICLCNANFGGELCEIPMTQIVGGVVSTLYYNAGIYLPFRIADQMAGIFKSTMAKEINLFCRGSQANYLQCCGSGTLPTTGPMDFVDASSVHVWRAVPEGNGVYVTIYATAKGNNGLCRKRTSHPPPIVAVPPEVVGAVYESKIASKEYDCCSILAHKGVHSYEEHYNFVIPKMNYISIRVG